MTGGWLTAFVFLWVLVALLVVSQFALARQIGLLHRRIPPFGARMASAGPAIGERGPDFEVTDLEGRRVVPGATEGKGTLLLFVSSECNGCEQMMPAARTIARTEKRHLVTVFVALDPADVAREFARKHRLDRMHVVTGSKLDMDYGVTSSPYAILLDDELKVRSKGIVNSMDHLESVIRAMEQGFATVEDFHIAAGTARSPESPGGVPSPRMP